VRQCKAYLVDFSHRSHVISCTHTLAPNAVTYSDPYYRSQRRAACAEKESKRGREAVSAATVRDGAIPLRVPPLDYTPVADHPSPTTAHTPKPRPS
jgi:hypothetical protein